MPSERTFFNKAIYKRALSRFWIIGAAYAVVLCFLTLMCGQYFNSEFTEVSEYVSYSILSNLTRREILAAAAAAVVMAVAVYGWMFRKTSAAYISALPVTREALLISSLLAGLTLLILPCIFAMLVSLLLYGGAGSPCTPYLLCSAAAAALMNIAFFGLASFCTVFTGNAAVLPALYVIALYGFVGIEVVTRYIAEFLLFGVRGTGWELAILSPLYYFFNNYVGSYSYALPLTAIYAAAGVILAGLAVIFFRRRRMEAAGEVVAVPVLRPIFRWGLAAVGALGMALLILKTVFNVGSYAAGNDGTPARVAILLLAMLFGAAVGWFGAEALMRKTLRVFDRHWKGLGVFCALLCALVVVTELDVFGVERYQPDVDEIGYATVNGWGEYNERRIIQPENIEKLLSLQKDIIANKKAYENQNGINTFPLTIEYYGTDGKLLARRVYTYAADKYPPYVTGGNVTVGFPAENDTISRNIRRYEELLNSRELMEGRALFPCDRSETAVFSASIQWYVSNSPTQQGLTLTPDEFWELYDTCIVPDLRRQHRRRQDHSGRGFLSDDRTDLHHRHRRPHQQQRRIRLQLLHRPSAYGLRAHKRVAALSRRHGADARRAEQCGCGIKRQYVRERPCRINASRKEKTMKKRVVILILTLVFLAGAMAAAGLPLESRAAAATSKPTETPAVTPGSLPEISPAPEETEPLTGIGGILERLAQDYDPASGAVGAYRWAESVLGQYLADGRDTASARAAGAAYAARYGENDAALKTRLETVRTAAEALTSGQELGLVRDRRLLTAGWESGEVDTLFAAIAAGAAIA